MTTALQLIEDAALEIGVKEEGQTLSGEQSAHGLRVLNRMLGRWSQRRLLMPVMSDVSIPLNGSAFYTLGPTGAVVTSRPIRVEMARHLIGGVEYPVDIASQQQWNGIADKTVSGEPVEMVFYDATSGNGTLRVYPAALTGTLKINSRTLIASFPTLATVVTLPDGYEDAIVPCLADALAASYGKATPADVLRRATAGLRAIKNANAEPLYLSIDSSGGDFHIERGY